MMKITQKLVENLQVPERGHVIFRDRELKGFALRCTPGGLSFIVEARVNGKSRRRTIGRGDLLSVSQARQEAIKLLAEMATGKDPAEEKRRAQNGLVTLGHVLDDYLLLHELRQNDGKGDQ